MVLRGRGYLRGGHAQAVSPAEAQAIARNAYVYSYAMMESYQTWRTQAVDKNANGYVAGFNVFRCISARPICRRQSSSGP
jgi:hypothetical protein